MTPRAQVGSFLIEEILNWPLGGLEQDPLGRWLEKRLLGGKRGGEGLGRSGLSCGSRVF